MVRRSLLALAFASTAAPTLASEKDIKWAHGELMRMEQIASDMIVTKDFRQVDVLKQISTDIVEKGPSEPPMHICGAAAKALSVMMEGTDNIQPAVSRRLWLTHFPAYGEMADNCARNANAALIRYLPFDLYADEARRSVCVQDQLHINPDCLFLRP